MYDVANRETFDALPRWYSELETYVSSSVVKILVGNKVDKVDTLLPFLHILLDRANVVHITQEFSRQVSTSEGAAFAERMGSLFVEASAKTAVGVRQAFTDVVERILDTPELWAPVSNITPDVPRNGSIPGNIDLNSRSDTGADAGGCGC